MAHYVDEKGNEVFADYVAPLCMKCALFRPDLYRMEIQEEWCPPKEFNYCEAFPEGDGIPGKIYEECGECEHFKPAE